MATITWLLRAQDEGRMFPWSDEDTEWRKGAVTGSMAAAVCGESKFQTARQQAEIALGIKKRSPFGAKQIEQMRFGSLSEHIHLQLLEEFRGIKSTIWDDLVGGNMTWPRWEELGATDDSQWSIQSAKQPRFYATPDAVTEAGDTLIELKAIKYSSKTWWKEGPPVYYKVQLLWQMMVCEVPKGMLSCLVDGRLHDNGPWHFERNEVTEARMIKAATDYINSIDAGKLPPQPYPLFG